MADQSGSLTWNISDCSLTKFLSASNGLEFASEPFSAGSFTFQCKVYPNGRKREQKGCVMLYFVLQTSLGNKISKITVKARLYCPQTLCDWKHIQHLKKDNAGIGWHSKNMLLSEAKQHSHLKFICSITILRIEYKSDFGSNINHKLCKMNLYTKYEWGIDSKLLESFQCANNGKFYHSDDYNFGSWCTSIAPNGANNKDIGNVKVGLQLLQLPPSVGKIKTKFSISCNYENIKCDGKKDFSYNSTFIAWGDGTLKTINLLNIASKISFNVEIIIIKMYDEYNKEINKSDWNKYGIINNININVNGTPRISMDDNNHDYKSIHSMDLSSNIQYNILSPSHTALSRSQFTVNTQSIQQQIQQHQEEKRNNNKNNNYRASITSNSIKDTITTISDDRSIDIIQQQNLAFIQTQQTQKTKINELREKIICIETDKTEDNKRMVCMEKSIINIQKSTNRIQQQQFDQCSMLKQCINDLSGTIQRLTNEIIFMKNKIKTMDNKIQNQETKISELEEENKNKNRSHSSKSSKKSRKSNHNKRRKSIELDKKKEDIKIDNAVKIWLKHDCNLPQYLVLFAQNGYDSIDIIKEMTRFELEDMGITRKGHQFKIIKEIDKLKYSRKHHRAKDKGMDMFHVANYLTPVASPNGSESHHQINHPPALTPKTPKSTNDNDDNETSPYLQSLQSNNDTLASSYNHHQHHQHSHHQHAQSQTNMDIPSPSHSTSVTSLTATSYTTSTTAGYMQFNGNNNITNFKSLLLESPSARHGFRRNDAHSIRYSPRNNKKQYHSHYIPQIEKMWECKSCHNSNLGTLDKCEFCGHQK